MAIWERTRGARASASFRIALLILAAIGLAGNADRPSEPGPWGLASFLRARVAGRSTPLVVCQLGTSPDWNQFRLEAVVERERLHNAISIKGLLGDRAWSASEAKTEECDLIMVLAHRGVPAEVSQQRANKDLEVATGQVLASGAWVPCPECPSQLGTRAPVTVLERTSARQGHGGGAVAAAEQALAQP